MDSIPSDLPPDLQQQLLEMNMSASQFKESAERSGLATHLDDTINTDESNEEYVRQDIEDDDDEEIEYNSESWENIIKQTHEETMNQMFENVARIVIEEESISGSDPQMTKAKMESSVSKMQGKLDSMSKRPKDLDEAKNLVETWANVRKIKLTKAKSEMLANVLITKSEATTSVFEWVLLGWDLRGESNVTEAKNLNQAMQELVNTVLSGQTEFKKSAANLISGFKECQQDVTTLVHQIRSEFKESKASINVPIGKQTDLKKKEPVVIPSPSTTPATPRLKSKPTTMIGKIDLLLSLIGKTREEMIKLYPIQPLLMILTKVVNGLTTDDWNSLGKSNGKLAMLELIAEEIEADKKKKKEKTVVVN